MKRKSLKYWIPKNPVAEFTKQLRCYVDDDHPTFKSKLSDAEDSWELLFVTRWNKFSVHQNLKQIRAVLLQSQVNCC